MASRMRRGFVALFLAGAVFAPLSAATDAGAGANRAGVVVNHGDDSVDTDCVRFNADRILAIDLLTRTKDRTADPVVDFDLYTTADPSLGRAVCWLDGEGHAPGTPCFDTTGGPNWLVWIRRKGQAEPKLASVGVSTLRVTPGAVLHLQFAAFGGPPDFEPPPAPDAVSVRSICGG